MTPDGDLGEWYAVTPVTLRATVAAYIAPPLWTATNTPTPGPTATGTPPTPTSTVAPPTPTITPPVIAAYACAHVGTDYLALSGVVTDDVVLAPTNNLDLGDAVKVRIDGSADGLLNAGLDDLDLLIGANGLVEDYFRVPLLATVGVSLTASGWQWEMLLPAAQFGHDDLAPGRVIGLLWGYIDRVLSSARWYIMASHWYRGVMQ